jgi:hypothetical protein
VSPHNHKWEKLGKIRNINSNNKRTQQKWNRVVPSGKHGFQIGIFIPRDWPGSLGRCRRWDGGKPKNLKTLRIS